MPVPKEGYLFLERHVERVSELLKLWGPKQVLKILLMEEPGLTRNQVHEFKVRHLHGVRAVNGRAWFYDPSALVDHEIAGYLVGFVLGDGCLGIEGGVSFQSTDPNVVYQIKDVLRAHQKVSIRIYEGEKAHWKPLYTLTMGNPSLFSWFRERGLWLNKSSKDSWEGRPISLPSEAWPHMLRGWYETDGCYSVRKDLRTRSFNWVCMSEPFITYMRGELLTRYGLNLHKNSAADTGIWKLETGCFDVLARIVTLLYPAGFVPRLFIEAKYRGAQEKIVQDHRVRFPIEGLADHSVFERANIAEGRLCGLSSSSG